MASKPKTRRDERSPFSERETATILAALRYFQRTGLIGHWLPEDEIANDGGTVIPLTRAEIDTLCERINCGDLL
jgi:hypothetical protein